MSKLREAAQAALEALEWIEPSGLTGRGGIEARSKAIDALRVALAEPEQEPTYCPTCGAEDGGTSCGMPNCGLITGDTPSPDDLEPPVPSPLGGGETTGPVTGGSIPKGWALVPVEPTQDMLDAAGVCPVPEGKAWLDESNRFQWAAMLAAAPQYKEPAHGIKGEQE